MTVTGNQTAKIAIGTVIGNSCIFVQRCVLRILACLCNSRRPARVGPIKSCTIAVDTCSFGANFVVSGFTVREGRLLTGMRLAHGRDSAVPAPEPSTPLRANLPVFAATCRCVSARQNDCHPCVLPYAGRTQETTASRQFDENALSFTPRLHPRKTRGRFVRISLTNWVSMPTVGYVSGRRYASNMTGVPSSFK